MSQHAQDEPSTNPRPRGATLAQDARTHGRASPRNPPLKKRLVLVLVLFACITSTLAIPLVESDAGNADAHYNAAPPAFGSGGDTTVPAGVELRSVFGSLTLSPTALSAANVTISICGGVVLENFNVPQISGATETLSFAFTVTGGDCYRFDNNLDPGAANRISAYNYVDVLNESFESRAHANATWESQSNANATAATECPLTDCANNTYLNSTIPPVRSGRLWYDRASGVVGATWDPSGLPDGGGVYVNFTGPASTISRVMNGASRNASNVAVADISLGCPGDATIQFRLNAGGWGPVTDLGNWGCSPSRGPHEYAIVGLSARSDANGSVHIEWDSNVADDQTVGWEIFGNNARDDGSFCATCLWGYTPDYFESGALSYAPGTTTGALRSFDGSVPDFTAPDANGTTFLMVQYYPPVTPATTELPDAGSGSSYFGGTISSCAIAFKPDGVPHSCGTLAPATGGGNVTTFLNQTFINATAGGGIQFVPFAWGRGQGSITLGATSGIIAGDAAGAQVYAPENSGGDPATIVPFGTSSINPSGLEASFGGATEMLHDGVLTSLRVRAFGPYNASADPVIASADAGATLAIQLQENGADVPSAVATWTAGEDAAKDIPLPNGTLPFLATDAFSLALTLTSADPVNDGANLYNALMGIAWNGTGNATFVNQTVFVNASGETFLPVLFGQNNENARVGDHFNDGSFPPNLALTGALLSAFGEDVLVSTLSPFPNGDGNTAATNGEDNVFTMTRNGTFLMADIRAIGPYVVAGDDTTMPSPENVSILVEIQKNNVTLGSATWTAGEVATKTITLTGGSFVEGDNFRIRVTPSNTAPANATYFNLVEATYGILWAGNATGGGGVVTSTITISTAFDQWIPLLIWGGLLVLFIWLLAWAPALGALMALTNAIFPHPLWSTAASVLLVAVLLIIHALATRGILPLPWGKKE